MRTFRKSGTWINLSWSESQEHSRIQGWLVEELFRIEDIDNPHAGELSQHYGNIPARSVGAILRSLVILEQQGAA